MNQNARTQSIETPEAMFRNYPYPTERQHVTQVTHVAIDGTSNPYVGHTTEQIARNYAAEVTGRSKSECAVYAPAGSGGARLAVYRNGEARAD